MTETEDDLAIRRKKLLYRSQYTGTKETDIVLSRFATAHLQDFGSDKLDLYEQMLDAGDPEILAWVTRRKAVPAAYDNAVTRMLMEFEFFQPGD